MTFDLLAPHTLDDPYPAYARLRRDDPVHWSEKLRSWLLVRHADVLAALRDDERLSADRRRSRRGDRWEEAPPVLRNVTSDPPACLPVRAILSATLAPRVRALRARIDAVVERSLDAIAAAGARGEAVDLVAALAAPLPIDVIATLLAVPDEERPRFAARSAAIARGMDRLFADPGASTALREIGAWFLGLVGERRGTPGDDLVRALLVAEHRGERLGDLEVVALCTALVFGGHETTVGLIANGVLALLRHPDALERLRAEPGLVPPAVEELVRFDGPAHLISRTATADVEIDGRRIRAGDSVLLALGAANRDPDAFAEPDELHVARSPNPHLGFGFGTHFCPGAQLARLEAQAAIGGLVARFPRLRLDASPPVRRRTAVLRGLERLPVRVD